MKKAAIALGIISAVIFLIILASCGGTTTTKTTSSIDRTVIGEVQTIDSYSDYSILRFDGNVNIKVTNSSLSNWRVGNMFGQTSTYQLQGVGMSFDDGYHEYSLVNFQIGRAIIGGE